MSEGERKKPWRFFDKAALVGIVAIIVSLFLAVISADRDAQKQANSSINAYAQENNDQHQELGKRLVAIETFLCAKFHWRCP